MQSETGFSSSHQLKSYVAYKSRLKLAACAVLSTVAGFLVITANMQSETGFPSSHHLKSYVASKSRLKLAARCPVSGCWPSCFVSLYGYGFLSGGKS